MTANGILQIILYLIVLVALVKPLGGYIARVYQAEPCGLDRMLGPLERFIYRMLGIRPGTIVLESVCRGCDSFQARLFFL